MKIQSPSFLSWSQSFLQTTFTRAAALWFTLYPSRPPTFLSAERPTHHSDGGFGKDGNYFASQKEYDDYRRLVKGSGFSPDGEYYTSQKDYWVAKASAQTEGFDKNGEFHSK